MRTGFVLFAAALLATLPACDGGGASEGPDGPAPPTSGYVATVLPFDSLAAASSAGWFFGVSKDRDRDLDFGRLGVQTDGRGGLFVQMRNNRYIRAYRATPAGFSRVAVPEGYTQALFGPHGTLYTSGEGRGIESGRGTALPYAVEGGTAGTVPFVYTGGSPPNGLFGQYYTTSGLWRRRADGTLVGWTVGSQGVPKSIWTWRPGDAARTVLTYTGTPINYHYFDALPSNAAAGEQMLFRTKSLGFTWCSPCGSVLTADVRRADGTVLMAEDMLPRLPNVVLMGWTSRGYVLRTWPIETTQNRRWVYWRDGVVTDINGAVETVSEQGEMLLVRGTTRVYVDAGGAEHVLPASPLPPGSSITSYFLPGNGLVYQFDAYVPGDRVQQFFGVARYVPAALAPSSTLALSNASPADRIDASAFANVALGATRRADGSSVTVSLAPAVSATGHTRRLTLTLSGPLAAGQTLAALGTTGGVTVVGLYMDIANGSVYVMRAETGTIRVDEYDGSRLKLTLQNVVAKHAASGASVTLNGTLTVPEVVTE